MIINTRPHEPIRNKTSVYMFVGLQGNGKTTTVAKYAYHYKRQGFKCAMVCADTYRYGIQCCNSTLLLSYTA